METRNILDAGHHAYGMAKDLSAAYWADSYKEYLIQCAHENFLQLAEAMGYTVEKKDGN